MSNTPWTPAAIPSQQGITSVVTGANSGIGWETARELTRAGGEVILTSRSAEKGQDAVARILAEIPKAAVRFEVLDLADLASVKAFAGRIGKLDLLINNAGVMSVPQRRLTKDGFEMQFGTNFLGPFALTAQLMPVLLRSASPRVVTVSSGAASMGLKRIHFADLNFEQGYNPWKAYCQTKLADLHLALELGRRADAANLKLLSVMAHPGYARTNLQTSGPGRKQNFLERVMQTFISHDAAHGAYPTLRAATEKSLKQGAYFAPDKLFNLKGNPVPIGIPSPARDEATAKRLWDVAQEMTGVRFEGL